MRFQRRTIGNVTLYVVVDETGCALAAATTLESLQRGDTTSEPELLFRLNGDAGVLLSPVAPSKIVCVGLNYRRHAEEMNIDLPSEPLIFLKPSTAVIGPGDSIILPESSREVHHEGELAVVIGRTAHHVPEDRASDVILGFTIMNDVTARDIQRRERKYTRSKGFDTFAPLGPDVVSDVDPERLMLEVRVNGELRQSSGCDDLIFKVPRLVAFISDIMTLLPGDIISTGTPSGVGPLRHGDEVEVTINGIGTLTNSVNHGLS